MTKMALPSRFIRFEKSKGTVATRSKHHGYFNGRRAVSGQGDMTPVRRLTRATIIHGEKEQAGEIFGRGTAIRASGHSRAHLRRA